MENQEEAIEVNAVVYTVAEFNEMEATIEAIKEKCNFVPDMSTKEGHEKSKRLSLDIGKGLTKIKDACKREKRIKADEGKQIQVDCDALIEKIEVHQLPHKEAYKGKDAEVKEEREAMDIKMQSLIRITSTARADRWSSALISEKINELLNDDCLQYGSKAADAIVQKKLVIDNLEAFQVEVIKEEEAAEELAQLRRENAERKEKEAQAEIDAANAEEPTGGIIDPSKHVTVGDGEPEGIIPLAGVNVKDALSDSHTTNTVYLPSIANIEKCEMLIGVIKSMHEKHREFMIQETLADESELPTYENSVEKKRVDGIMSQ